jgi:hypothetical protein
MSNSMAAYSRALSRAAKWTSPKTFQ